ncbi:MAG TPA: hypothetical protein PKK33_09795 [Candidatus Cloacimonadota bacterium]|nr:hypothetical protein [Candidatus Cloacimonadota bacterium]
MEKETADQREMDSRWIPDYFFVTFCAYLMEKSELAKRFEAELWPLNTQGDYEDTLEKVEFIISMNYTDHFKNKVTFEYILDKYRKYMGWWENTIGVKGPQWIKESERLKSIFDFLDERLFFQSFELPRRIRDLYIFGTESFESLNIKLKAFKSSFKHGRK